MPRAGPSYAQHIGPVRSDDWGVRAMRARCATLRSHLVARGGMDESVLAAWWPGGAENRTHKAYGWNICHTRYAHLAGKADALRDPSDGAADRRLARAVDDSLTDAPIAVTTSDGERRQVYPKSHTTHAYLTHLDDRIAALALADLNVMEAAADLGLTVEPIGLRADVVCLWLWIVTTPGTGMPFLPTLAPKDIPPAPAWTQAVTPEDVLALVQAFHDVDQKNIAIMSAGLSASGRSPSRLSFAGFLGGFAAAHHLDPLAVTREWAVRRVIATAASEHEAHESARRDADTQRVRDAMRPPVPVTHA